MIFIYLYDFHIFLMKGSIKYLPVKFDIAGMEILTI